MLLNALFIYSACQVHNVYVSLDFIQLMLIFHRYAYDTGLHYPEHNVFLTKT